MPLTIARRGDLFAAAASTPVGYAANVLALNPDHFWTMQETSGATLADTGKVGGKDLTIAGGSVTYSVSTGFAGVGTGINFGNSGAYAWVNAALTQIVANKFSVCGWHDLNSALPAFSVPMFCASVAAGHVDPFYTFFIGAGASGTNWRLAIATTGTFTPIDTGVAVMSTGTWRHVALVYDGSLGSNNVKLWINGVIAYQGALTGNVGAMGSFAVGTIPALRSAFADQRVSCEAYWSNYALTASDIATLYAARN
jgi:hypothetical protein